MSLRIEFSALKCKDKEVPPREIDIRFGINWYATNGNHWIEGVTHKRYPGY